MKYLMVVLGIVGLYSCSPTRQLKKCAMCYSLLDTTSTTVIKDSFVTILDTVTHTFWVEADTTIQILEIVCDSTGTATIKKSEKSKGNRSDLRASLSNNVLSIKGTCDKVVDSLEFIIRNTERHLSKEVLNAIKVPKLIEAKLNWWQKIKVRFGGYAFLIIALFVVYKGGSIYYKVNTPMGLLLMIKRRLLR